MSTHHRPKRSITEPEAGAVRRIDVETFVFEARVEDVGNRNRNGEDSDQE